MMQTNTLIGQLSGKRFTLPNVNQPPMPLLGEAGVICNGEPVSRFGSVDSHRGYPDVRSFRRKFGLLIPATNTSVEHELWSIIFSNQGSNGLEGVGLHTANVITAKPELETDDDLRRYKEQFIGGLSDAVATAKLAQPEYLIMSMSLEHIISGIEDIRALMTDVEESSGLAWATWHDAIEAALKKFAAKRIGLLTPFDKVGNASAVQMSQELGFEVVSSVGFSCANALHIAHVPDWAKEKAIVELLANAENQLDAVVQCGTNMSLVNVSERLEPILDIPILGINAVTFWYALRETGISGPQFGASRLLREY